MFQAFYDDSDNNIPVKSLSTRGYDCQWIQRFDVRYDELISHRHYYSDRIFECCEIDQTQTNKYHVDVDNSQIRYVINDVCNTTGFEIDVCRCVFCLPLHSAGIPDIVSCEPSEYIAVVCRKGTPYIKLMVRRGVITDEDRAEFTV